MATIMTYLCLSILTTIDNPNGFCSYRNPRLECDTVTHKCKCYNESLIWLPSESKCLLAPNQPCAAPPNHHKDCATKFCNNGKCDRQVGQGQKCPSAMNEQCSSGFCDPKKKVCAYNSTPEAKSAGFRLKPMEYESLDIGILLTSIVNGLFGLWPM